jgi:hypothetical protein
MPLLNPSSFITANPLEDFSIRYANDLAKFAALRIFLPHVVSKKTGQFYSYSKDNLKVKDLNAPSGSEARMHSYTVSKKTYTTKEKAIKGLVLEKDARDFDRPVADLDQEMAMQNMDALMIELEAAMYTKISTTSNYPSALVNSLTDSVDRWADSAGEPLDDVRELRQEVFEYCAKRPNVMAMSQKGLDILKLNPSIVDRIKYTGQSVTTDIIKMLMELDEIVISDVVKNTAVDGAADSLSEIWGDEALLFYRDPAARLKGMTFGKAFIANQMYVKTIDKPELGRSLGAHELESGWEYTLESCATTSSSDDDFVAGGLIDNIY